MPPFIITSPMLSWRAEALDAFSRRIFQWSEGFFLWAGSNKSLKPQHSRDSHDDDDSDVFGFLYLALCILKKRLLVNDSNNFQSKICLFYLLHLSWINLTQHFFYPLLSVCLKKKHLGKCLIRPWWSIKSNSQFFIFTFQCSCSVYVFVTWNGCESVLCQWKPCRYEVSAFWDETMVMEVWFEL